MMLEDLLEQQRDIILEKWFDLIIASYPADSERFLKSEKDRFRNPVGYTIRREIEVLFRVLLKDGDAETLATALDNIVKIRSVQDFTPSQAIAFVFLLKKAVREILLDRIERDRLVDQLLDFESRVDGLALAAFDNYMSNKSKIFEIRAREIDRRSEKLLERVTRMDGERDQEENGGE